MVDLTVVLGSVSALAVVAGVVVGIRELHHYSEVQQAEVIRSISERLADPEFAKSYLLLAKMKTNTTYEEIDGKPEEIALINWGTYIEGLAIAVKRGIIPIGLVDDYWHGAIRVIWEHCECVIRSFREKYNHPEFCEWMEYLYLRIYGKSGAGNRRLKELEKSTYSRRTK